MKLRRKRNLQVLIPIATMGDIAFLLIIFFILASNFVRESKLEYKLPEARELDPLELQPISVVMDEDGVVYLQGDVSSAGSLEYEVAAMVDKHPARKVTVKIHKTLTEKEFGPVLLALSKAGVENFDLTGVRANP